MALSFLFEVSTSTPLEGQEPGFGPTAEWRAQRPQAPDRPPERWPRARRQVPPPQWLPAGRARPVFEKWGTNRGVTAAYSRQASPKAASESRSSEMARRTYIT